MQWLYVKWCKISINYNVHLAEKHLYVIWFAEGLKHEGSSNWRWKKQSSKCPPWKKTYYWNEFAKSHPWSQIPGLAAFEYGGHSIFWLLLKLRRILECIPECKSFRSMDQVRHKSRMTVQHLDNKRIKKLQKCPNSVHSGILSPLTHFGSLRGLLHPGKSLVLRGWHVPLSFLTLFDSWNDLKHEWLLLYHHPPYPADFRAHGMFSCFRLLHGLLYPHFTQSPKSVSK